jgi:ubiquinone biosynthesis protein
MPAASATTPPHVAGATPQALRAALESFLPPGTKPEARVAFVTAALRGEHGAMLRSVMGEWIVETAVPARQLVPDSYRNWRPVVRDAMLFVMNHLSAERLAPKLLEQLELPATTRPERRLLRLIAEVPGLQKLGQVLARNRHLRPRLKRSLIALENGIHDVEASEIRAIVLNAVGKRLDRFDVRIAAKLMCEASVSAILPFTWRNPQSRQRERGVFKVIKPHIPVYFREDMQLLQDLTRYFGARLHEYGFATDVLSDTFAKVRRLLQHEIDFHGEQRTLGKAAAMYGRARGVRVPRLIKPLSTASITAMSQERGVKITAAAARMSMKQRSGLAEQLVQALVAIPLFSSDHEALFHADPHAGNLLYDRERGEIIVLDWALTERLGATQRRHLALLLMSLALRDPIAVSRELEALQQARSALGPQQQRRMQELVSEYVDAMPLSELPGAVDAMRLIERLTLRRVRFPASLVMLSKVLFTLDGILGDIGGADARLELAVARHALRQWVEDRARVRWPLRKRDWVALNCSALLYPSRVCVKWEEALARKLLGRASNAATA